MAAPIRTDLVSALRLERPEIPAPSSSGEPSFADVFQKVLGDTGRLQDDAQDLIGRFLRGEPVELHQVMAASEEASISLELLVEIRNKLTDAYKTLMNLQ